MCKKIAFEILAGRGLVSIVISYEPWRTPSLSVQGRIQTVAPVARATVRFPNLIFWKIMDCYKYPDMVLAV